MKNGHATIIGCEKLENEMDAIMEDGVVKIPVKVEITNISAKLSIEYTKQLGHCEAEKKT
ncbi:MAG: hypothetical protein KAT05_16265 [Spirochaetes bacterium]|nr:hypothetical protein [Spirochaetota bacterium]